jgi:3D (Asp-Asp-Asp) domain-containing protein
MLKPKLLIKSLKPIVASVAISLLLQSAPVYAETVHTTVEGDTYYLLSQKYNVDLDKLVNSNPTIQANNIYPGLSITIPDGKVTQSSTTDTEILHSGTTEPTLNVFANDKVVEVWGKAFNYSNTIDVRATAYSAAASENGKWGAVDYFGSPLKLGTIAVDPKVIPMGTKVLVTGHSHPGLPKKAFVATATDQGSAIKGNRIDIFIPGSQSSVSTFGFQDVKLYVLD